MAIKTSFTFVGIDKITNVANNVSKSVAKVAGGFKKVENQTEKTNTKLQQTGKILGSLKGKVAGLAAGFVGFQAIKSFITVGADFQDSLLDLSSITGSVGEDLQFLTDESLRMSKATGIAAKDVAGAFKIVASAKSELLSDLPALSNVTEQVLLLSDAAGIDLASSGKVLTESLNQFGVASDQANRFVNVLAAGSKVGASEVAETGVAVVKSAVAAKLAGLSFEELNSMIQVLAKNGIKAEVAGTGLKTALLQLEKSGIKQITPSVVGLDSALENLASANLSTSELFKLFGAEAISIGDILIKNRSLVSQWTAEITGTNVAQEQANTRIESFNKKLAKIAATIQAKLITAFFRLEPFLTEQATKFADWIDSLDEEKIKSFADSVISLAKGLADLASSLASVGRFFSTSETVFGKNAFSEFLDRPISSFFESGENNATQIVEEQKTITQVSNQNQQALAVEISLSGDTSKVESVKSQAKSSGLKVRTNME